MSSKIAILGSGEQSQEDVIGMGEAADELITLDVGGRKVVKLLYPHVRQR